MYKNNIPSNSIHVLKYVYAKNHLKGKNFLKNK